MKKIMVVLMVSSLFRGFAQNNIDPSLQQNSVQSTNATFIRLTKMVNIYSFLQSSKFHLQYHNDLNTVSLIMRAGPNYSASPANNSGAIVAFIGKNFGTVWDSTCLWSNANLLGRHPQGAIYNPPSNTNLNNAYVVACGPLTTATNSAWIGNFYASKSLSGAGTNIPGADQQTLYTNLTTYPGTQARHHFSDVNFTATDDGKMRSIAMILNNPNANVSGIRGTMIVNGVFNAGAFVWTTDSIIPPVMSTTLGEKYIGNSFQAWNEAGTVGYVVILGVRTGATNANRGVQPLIYKTTNGGATWMLLNAIDFNNSVYQHILNRLGSVDNNGCLIKPYFRSEEGLACVVDNSDKLHIITTLASTSRDEQDSLAVLKKYMHNGDEFYWKFVANQYPYIYDFSGDGSAAWGVNIVDSMGTMGPGYEPGTPGFYLNPWDVDGSTGLKVRCGARIQAGRSADGKHILYSWAEADTNLTTNQAYYTEFPDLYFRAWNSSSNGISEKIKINAVGASGLNNLMYMHSISPAVATFTSGSSVTFTTPLTVTKSNPLAQTGTNTVYYSNAVVTFTNYAVKALSTGSICTAMAEQELLKNRTSDITLYPNPTSGDFTITRGQSNLGISYYSVYDCYGKLILHEQMTGKTHLVNAKNLKPGIYFVTVESDGRKAMPMKLVVE